MRRMSVIDGGSCCDLHRPDDLAVSRRRYDLLKSDPLDFGTLRQKELSRSSLLLDIWMQPMHAQCGMISECTCAFHSWLWVKIQIEPLVNIPIPAKLGSKMGGEFTYPNMAVLNHGQLSFD